MAWNEKLAIIAFSLLVLLVSVAIGISIWGFSYSIEPWVHFQIQYWIGAMLLLALLAATRKKTLFWVGLVFVSMLSVNLITWYVPTNTQAKPFLKILSSNNWTFNQNYPAVLELVRKENPDVAMFYEVTPAGQQQLDTLSDIFPYSTGRGTDALIYTKFSLNGTKIWQSVPAYPSTTIVENLRHLGKTFTLVATHPPSPRSKKQLFERNKLLNHLGQHLAASGQNLIVGGDFNVSMWSPYYHDFVEKAQLTNTRQGFGVIPTWAPSRVIGFPAWLKPWFSVPIDHIFIRSNDFELRTLKMKAGDYVGSDHLPVIAEIGVVDQ